MLTNKMKANLKVIIFLTLDVLLLCNCSPSCHSCKVNKIHSHLRPKHIRRSINPKNQSVPETTTWAPDPKDLVGLYEEEMLPRNTDAYFATSNNTEVTVQVGSTAALPCEAYDVAEHETVSWIRHKDHHIITVCSNIYSNDARFQITHSDKSHDWTLHIRWAQAQDNGIYECQITAHPPISIYIRLNVIEAISEISGGTARHIQVGSSVHLTCIIKNLQEPPTYVFWYHERQMINYDTRRRVTMDKTDGSSELMIDQVIPEDSGNYTCHPSNARPSSFSLHVITGEMPAAMQKASGTGLNYPLGLALISTIAFLFS